MALDINIQNSLLEQSYNIKRIEIQKTIQNSFQKKKNEMLADFKNHPITLEIKGGINSANISKTLGGGSGNLFSFIGFESGYDPIKPIEDLLLTTSITFSKFSKKSIEYTVYIPDAKDIFDATPMPWAPGRSWARGIETGISGLGYYLRKESDSSRSGIGIQSPRKVRRKGSKFKNTSYISALIKTYLKEFQNLEI